MAAEQEALVDTRARKAIRFAEVTTSVVYRKVGEKEELYIQNHEHLQSYRKTFAEMKVFESTCGLHLEGIYDCSVQERIDRLVDLHRVASPVRGLERIICSEHGMIRTMMRKRAIHEVLCKQKVLLDKGVKSSSQRADALASIAQGSSHCARVFARVVGMADQRIVREELDSYREPEQLKEDASSEKTSHNRMFRRSFSGTSSKKLSKMMKRIGGGSFRNKPNRRSSPTSAIEEFSHAMQQQLISQDDVTR